MHRRTKPPGMLEQKLVEQAAVDVIRVGLGHAGLIAFREVNFGVADIDTVPGVVIFLRALGRGPHRAVFPREAVLLHLVKEPDLAKHACRGRHQRFTDVGPRKLLSFVNHASQAGLGEIGAERGARRTAADDSHVKIGSARHAGETPGHDRKYVPLAGGDCTSWQGRA
jgi:hypothetical protein